MQDENGEVSYGSCEFCYNDKIRDYEDIKYIENELTDDNEGYVKKVVIMNWKIFEER